MSEKQTEREKQIQDQYDRWREVTIEKAQYCIVLRADSYDTSILFYKSKEDAEWALLHSWFDEKTPVVARLLNTKLDILEDHNIRNS